MDREKVLQIFPDAYARLNIEHRKFYQIITCKSTSQELTWGYDTEEEAWEVAWIKVQRAMLKKLEA